LRERLVLLKDREEAERAKKRQSILGDKVEKVRSLWRTDEEMKDLMYVCDSQESELQKKMENLGRFRALAEQEARQKCAIHSALAMSAC
jgi:hypothetical protein